MLNIDLWGLREGDLLDAFTFPETKFPRRIQLKHPCDLAHSRQQQSRHPRAPASSNGFGRSF
ncbi:MAG: hypothetical protein EBZ24_12075 [Synechococcaceae bacterium WB9_4xB_025]|nr:hypothetical protein [Synechococcaceae bacterium WB9_4xB_025]